ncbi:hypothetical protein HYV80_01045 [Candidatus Woesearchaeota archaeon]|nr:hypothetical protein [Candidatus Woesearchaeota archaeon]
MGEDCCSGVCAKCHAAKFVVVGAVVLATAAYWPDKIWHVLGVLLILKGVLKMAMPSCGHCQVMPKKGKK